MTSIDVEELTKRLESHATFFDEKLSFIPPRVYWAGKSDPNQYQKKRDPSKKKAKKTVSANQKPQPKKIKLSELKKFKPRATLPELIDQGRFGSRIASEEVTPLAPPATMTPVAATTETEKSAQEAANSHMSEIAEKLGFVPGSVAKSPAELKRRMQLLRDWYKEKNKRPRDVSAEGKEEKKNARQLKKAKQKEKRKTLKKQKQNLSAAAAKQKEEAEEEAVQRQQQQGESQQDLALEFGTFKFSSGRAAPLYKEKRGRDVELLRKAEAERDKKKAWAAQEDGSQKLEELEWDKMMLKAQGAKIKDDPQLLRKTIKKKERRKRKAQAEWADKTQALEKSKREKQQDYLRRQDKNLARRKLGRRGASAAPSSSSSSSRKGRAGFEGNKKKLNK